MALLRTALSARGGPAPAARRGIGCFLATLLMPTIWSGLPALCSIVILHPTMSQ